MSPIISRLGFSKGFGRRLGSLLPRYSVTPSTSSVNEGSSVTFTITTTNVPSGTTLYWSTNTVSGTVNSSDFNDAATTGSFTITNNTGSVVRTLSNDATTEGSESFQLQIRTGSTSGTIVATSTTVTINDTSLDPTYSVSPSTSSVNEGSSVVFTVTTTNVPNQTVLYWTTLPTSGTVNSSDFLDGNTSGSFEITGNSGSITRTLSNDATTEGSESFQLQIRTGSTSGTIVATSTTVTINDTSVTPVSATGGTTFDSGGYRIHVFTSPGSFVISNGGSVEYVVVAGGGAGGTNRGGGGGAGGFRTGSFSISPGSYPIQIGAGGAGGSNGSPSIFSSITSWGGGRGGDFYLDGQPGGSGGGGGHGPGAPGGAPRSGGVGNRETGTTNPTPSQGNDGGFGLANPLGGNAGGGGGAGGSGSPAGSSGGDGGIGAPVTWGLPSSYGESGPSPGRWFSYGGGGGACFSCPGTTSSGGNGAPSTNGSGGSYSGFPAMSNTGGGGGGSGEGGGPVGSGGSGIVLLRYLL